MAKITIEFDTENNRREEINAALEGSMLACVLFDIQNDLFRARKNDDQTKEELIEQLFEHFRDFDLEKYTY